MLPALRWILAALLLPAAACAGAPPPCPDGSAPPCAPPHAAAPPPTPADRCAAGEAEACFALGDGAQDEVEALRLFEVACKGGVAAGCARLGRMLEQGRGEHKPDEGAAMSVYKAACEKGEAEACAGLGRLTYWGKGVYPDAPAARALLEKGCEGGSAEGCTWLGVFHETGTGGPRDDARAVALYTRGCDGGVAEGCHRLGGMERDGRGTARDAARSLGHERAACEARHPLACHWVANLLEATGEGEPAVAAARARACSLGAALSCSIVAWTEHCLAGSADDCEHLGIARLFHHEGLRDPRLAEHDLRGGRQSLAEAARMWGERCEKGDLAACARRGRLLERGLGGAADGAGAVELYKKACEGGVAVGCARLAELAEARSPAEAARLYQRACTAKEGAGCAGLARLQRAGTGVARDRLGGAAALDRGCRAGSGEACREESELIDRMAHACTGQMKEACASGEKVHAIAIAGRENAQDALSGILREAAIARFTAACDAGDARACGDLALEWSVTRMNHVKAIDLYERGCDGGDLGACEGMANMLANLWSSHTPRDPGRAAWFYRVACEGGSGGACWAQAAEAEGGVLGAKDLGRAAGLFQRSCDLGVARACIDLAYRLGGHDGYPQDDRRAASLGARGLVLDRRACDQGNGGACFEAAELLGAKDAAGGKRLYKQACENGYTHGCAAIGTFHFMPAGPSRRP